MCARFTNFQHLLDLPSVNDQKYYLSLDSRAEFLIKNQKNNRIMFYQNKKKIVKYVINVINVFSN